MITKRIIPCLDVKDGRVVKGVKFEGLSDVSSPVELGKYYSDCGADELVFYDITASAEGRVLFTDILTEVAQNIFIPLTVGGGINTLADFDRVLKCGADKVSVNSGAIRNPELIREAAQKYDIFARTSPEEKFRLVQALQSKQEVVGMTGDGVNDAPALKRADVGIAISDGAEIAREIADIMVSSDDLYQIVTLKLLSDGLMKRIRKNYRVIVGFNTGLILLGVGGILQPTTSALLHNTSTLVISLKSMQNLLS